MSNEGLLTLESSFLKVDINPNDLATHVTVKDTGETLLMAKGQHDDVLMHSSSSGQAWKSFTSAENNITKSELSVTADLPHVGLQITISIDGADVVFKIAPEKNDDEVFPRDVLYPRHFILPRTGDAYAVFPFGQGCILPADREWNFHHREGYAEGTMFWIGGYTGKTGFIGIAETPHDLYQAVDDRPEQAASCFFHWLGSLGKLSYPRIARYHFAKGLDYIKQARIYREWTKRIGWYKSMEQKIDENPNAAKLIGAPIVTVPICSRRVRTFEYSFQTFDNAASLIESFHKLSEIKNAVVHVDGWGYWGYDAMHPDVLPVNTEAGGPAGLKDMSNRVKNLGYLFGLHDQYIDYYAHAPSYNESKSIVLEDRKPVRVNRWCGGLCGHLTYKYIPGFVKRNYYEGVRRVYPIYHNSSSIWDICQPTASYLDCFMRTVEDWSEEHAMTREYARSLQIEAIGLVRQGKDEQMVVQSVEHPRDYALPVLEFGWSIGHMMTDVPTTTGEMHTTSLGLSTPFWHLCFHDAICLPHPRDDFATLFLYAQAPYFMLGYREELTKKDLKDYHLDIKKKILALHEDAGIAEMTDFKHLSDDGKHQIAVYDNGLEVEVNRIENTYRISEGKAKTDGPVPLPETVI
jgi:hypothetical protein